MDRKSCLRSLAVLPITAFAGKFSIQQSKLMNMELNDLNKITDQLGPSDKMPVLFVGHGNPMNAITKNSYSETWAKMGKELPLPRAILCISAHWLTSGTAVTMTDRPETIHDFGGFPDKL